MVDTTSNLVYLGRFAGQQGPFLLLEDADVHDRRESSSTNEKYIMETRRHGVKVNRKRVWLRVETVLSISSLSDIVQY